MGVSLSVSIISAVVLGSYLAVRESAPKVVVYPMLHASLVGFAVAVSAHPLVNYTALFGKTLEGVIPWWSYAAFCPYLVLLRGYVTLRRVKSKEPVYTEVSEGLFVGGLAFFGVTCPSWKSCCSGLHM